MVEPHSSNFRVITTNILGVRIFRKFTVLIRFKCESEELDTYQNHFPVSKIVCKDLVNSDLLLTIW